jgi:membrane fusion protein, multidrug efflux system
MTSVQPEPLEPPRPSSSENAPSGPSPEPDVRARPWYRRPTTLIIVLVVGLTALIVGVRYFRYAMSHESTDDAVVQAHVVGVSPRVASNVSRVGDNLAALRVLEQEALQQRRAR